MHTDLDGGLITEDSASLVDFIGNFLYSVTKHSPWNNLFVLVIKYDLTRFQLISLKITFQTFILTLPCSIFWDSLLIPILASCTLGNHEIFASRILSQISHPTFPSNPLYFFKNQYAQI